MLSLKKIRDLTLEVPTAPGRPAHLSAASGLVVLKSFLYVVADDEHHLGVFAIEGNAPGGLIRILDGDLPDDKNQRKRLKPDLESLLLLPPFPGCAHGALFAIGSGSKPNRTAGILLPLDQQGCVAGQPRVIDLSPLFATMGKQVGDLNIEGAILVGERLILLQRGSSGSENALIAVSLSSILLSLATGNLIDEMPFDIRTCDLGSINGVPLGFTDGAALPDGRIVFTAVAEDTADSYLDGPCVGAAIGLVADDGHLQMLERLNPGAKVEGVSARLENGRIHLLLVTDADDAHVPSSLCVAEIPADSASPSLQGRG